MNILRIPNLIGLLVLLFFASCWGNQGERNEKKEDTLKVQDGASDRSARGETDRQQGKRNARDSGSYFRYSGNNAFSFKMPPSWKIVDKDEKVLDLNGEVKKIICSFKDSVEDSRLNLEYFPAPNGAKLFDFAKEEAENEEGDATYKKISVAGREAIQKESKLEKDGKGNPLKRPKRDLVVQFLDSQEGEYRLHFQSLTEDETSLKDFEEILQSFLLVETNK